MKKITLLAACLWQLAAWAQPTFVKDSLDAYINKGMKDWQIPGLSIIIIKDGKVVVEKGFGVKELGQTDPVDEHTLFQVASNSKLFTGTILAKMEHEKKLSLDDKVSKYLPYFKLNDANANAMVTIRDLLCHRLGTKTFQGDFTFWGSNLSREAIVKRFALLKPSGQFRQDYGYCNTGFLAAGLVGERVTKKPWEVYVYDSIFMPLGMSETQALTYSMGHMNNASKPHSNSFGDLQVVSYDNIDNLGPAGSIVSNVHDMGKWLMMQLDSGRLNGKRILPWSVIQKTRDINIVTGSRKSPVLPVNVRGYGLGVFAADYNGRMLYWHTGGAFGFVTNTCFVPESNLAICILTNNDNQSFFEALRYQVLDAYLGVPYVNRSEQFLKGFAEGYGEVKQELAKLKSRVAVAAKPKFNIESLLGVYSNEVYGMIEVKRNAKNQYEVLFQNHPLLKAVLEYMDGNEFRISYNNPAYGQFAVKATLEKNEITGIEVRASDFVEYDAYSFSKLKIKK
jgi:CubicO group peptidase (beta-lactamase class C family)